MKRGKQCSGLKLVSSMGSITVSLEGFLMFMLNMTFFFLVCSYSMFYGLVKNHINVMVAVVPGCGSLHVFPARIHS